MSMGFNLRRVCGGLGFFLVTRFNLPARGFPTEEVGTRRLFTYYAVTSLVICLWLLIVGVMVGGY